MEYEKLLNNIITKDEIDKIQLGGAGPPPQQAPIKGTNNDPYLTNLNAIPEGLLRIINDGIDNIVRNIKSAFGNNINNVNVEVKQIIDNLTNLAKNIDNDLALLHNNFEGTNYNRVIIDVNDTTKIKTSITQEKYYLKNDTIDLSRNKDIYKRTQIETLDSDRDSIRHAIYTQKDGKDIEIMENSNLNNFNLPEKDATPKDIRTRLENCQLLEMLYLIKHEELMKTFAFTLNLFDKYKYAIKILLFILKNLVSKPNECPEKPEGKPEETPETPETPTKIKLPKALIPNIKKLLDDQAQVQKIIKSMQATIEKDDETTDKIHKTVKDETGIDDNITNENYPTFGPLAVNTAAD